MHESYTISTDVANRAGSVYDGQMTETLRTRQKRMARETILEALAEHVSESGSLDFSVAEVADRAGVSHRTVYNYFGDRQGLIDALSDWADAAMTERGNLVAPLSLSDVPAAIGPNFETFEDMQGVAEAFARIDTAESPGRAHVRRTETFAGSVGAQFPDLSKRERRAVAALVRQIVSVKQWYFLTREHGLTTSEAAEVSSWAVRLQIEALSRGDTPFIEEER